MLIADISVVLAWFYQETQTPAALQILPLIEAEGLLVPPLWWSELENGLVMGERRGRTTTHDRNQFLSLICALPIHTDETPRHRISQSLLDLARQHQLTAYDAAYLELAIREQVPLATFDQALRKAAIGCGLKILPELS